MTKRKMQRKAAIARKFVLSSCLIFNIFELVAIVLSVLIANLITEDGESNWFEGFQLLMAYAIMAVAFFFHP